MKKPPSPKTASKTPASSAFEEEILRGRTVPPVRELHVDSPDCHFIGKGAFALKVPAEIADEASGVVSEFARRFWGVDAKVARAAPAAKAPEGEAYAIRVTPAKVAISASSMAAVRYAMFTLRQLAESERGVATSRSFLLPCVSVADAPAMAFRGLHLCWFPETSYAEMERDIRMAAYYKFNYAVIESWGVLRYTSHPEFCWADHAVQPGEMRRLVLLAKDLGLTLVPQVNIFGHASAARSCTGKHALLDLHPEFAPLFEPDGWCWCLSNPATRQFLSDIVSEIHELFGNPPFFHLGCDEAGGSSTCFACRHQDHAKLVEDHLRHFHDLLAKRGARPMVWHDMLLDRRDPRWNGYIVCGDERLTGLLDKLPRDFIVCDWQYYYPDEGGKLKEPDWTTTKHFIASGRDTLACPWLNTAGTLSLGRCIEDHHGFGLLETSWHRIQGHDFFRVFFHGAWAAWNPHADSPNHAHCDLLALMDSHVRQTTQDMGATRYEDLGTSQKQIHGPYYN